MMCGLVGRYQCFIGTYCFHLQPWYPLTSPHGMTTQKIIIDIFTAMRTSNLKEGNISSPLIFSFALEYTVTNIQENRRRVWR
jgi:hypothetical protein